LVSSVSLVVKKSIIHLLTLKDGFFHSESLS
jgi:hypothetical protein